MRMRDFERLSDPPEYLCSTGIEVALMAVAVVGAATSIAAAQQQAKAANAAAGLSRFQARQAEVQGVIEGNAITRSSIDTQASNLARFGAAGFALGEGGAPEQVNEAVRRDADLNLQISRGNTSTASQFLTLQASQHAQAARAARLQGFSNAASGLARTGFVAYG